MVPPRVLSSRDTYLLDFRRQAPQLQWLRLQRDLLSFIGHVLGAKSRKLTAQVAPPPCSKGLMQLEDYRNEEWRKTAKFTKLLRLGNDLLLIRLEGLGRRPSGGRRVKQLTMLNTDDSSRRTHAKIWVVLVQDLSLWKIRNTSPEDLEVPALDLPLFVCRHSWVSPPNVFGVHLRRSAADRHAIIAHPGI
jgi:hypothetical protein